MSSIKKNIMQSIKTVILALLLIAGVNYAFAVDWTAPTATPPNGNTYAPLNVSSLGQLKDGGLTLNVARSSTNGLAVLANNNLPFALLVQGDGNVGIGVIQAGASLDIWDKIKIRGGSPGVGKVLTSDINGLASWQTPASGGGITGGTTNQIPKFSSATTLTNSGITENGSGNVGIGTLTPGAKLEVKGTGNQYIKLSSTATNVDIASQYSDGTNNSYSGLLGAAAGAGKWGVYNGGATRMVVDQSGNVGIGRNNPTKMLEVGGDTIINGTLRIGEVGGASTPAAGRVLTSIDTSGNASWKAGVESGFIYSTFTNPIGGGVFCGLTPNKAFVVTGMGRVRPAGSGTGSLVSFNVNGVTFQDLFSSNSYDGPFSIQNPVNSDASGCLRVTSNGSTISPTYLTVSFVG